MKLHLLYYPHSFLRRKAHEVRDFSADLASLAQAMRTVMQQNNGMGLAANQVGDACRLIVIEYPGDSQNSEPAIPFTVLINPKITNKSKQSSEMSEGCLSVPAVEIPIKRANEITVLAQSLTGKTVKLRAKGMLARIIQHEIDHLNAVLIVDYAQTKKNISALKTMVWGSTTFTTELLNTIQPNPRITITHLVTEEPKPSGRGKEVKPTIVRTYADTLKIPCLEPHTLTDERFGSYLKAQAPDLIIVAAYGKLLPPQILDIPRYGALNVHPSLLPRYRGATPIQAGILSGDEKTGVTIIRMSPQFDTGDMLAQSELPLQGTETYGELEPILAEIGGEIINEILPQYISGRLQAMPQNNNLASVTKKITSEDRWLNPADSAKINERKVRAFNPTPGTYTVIAGQRIKVLKAKLENHQLQYEIVQPSGKKPMRWNDFVRGYRQAIVFDPSLPQHQL